jgi:hypothetical protein
MSITVPVNLAPGELVDKITILEIKLERIEDETKLTNIRLEYDTLNAARDEAIPKSENLDQLTADLKQINDALWKIEDDIRDCERAKNFGEEFIRLARAVYVTNDKRMAIKRQINDLLGSVLVEEKSYAAY